MNSRRMILVLTVAASLPSALHAQRLNDARIAFAWDTAEAISARQGLVRDRVIAGSLGLAVGSAVGGFVGASLAVAACEPECGDMDAAGGIVLGVLLGGWVGTSVGATIPGESGCTRTQQFNRAMGGSALGAIGGGLLAAAFFKVPVLAVSAAVLGPSLGAAIAQGSC